MIPVAQVEDSGNYVCSVTGVAGNYQDTARLEVVASKSNLYPYKMNKPIHNHSALRPVN